MDIDDILKMLDWNNDLDIQREGRRKAATVKCLSVFMQPMDKEFNKNIGENCAIILSEKEDELLTPYLFRLLDWLQDLNWPGAIIILKRLQEYRNYKMLAMMIEDCIVAANALENESWLLSLAEVLISDEVKKNLNDNSYQIIKPYLEELYNENQTIGAVRK